MAKVEEREIGRPVLRKGDLQLVTGQASFIDNHTMPGMLSMSVVRTPYAHAKVNSVDVAPAKAMPGVVAAFSAADLEGEWGGPLRAIQQAQGGAA